MTGIRTCRPNVSVSTVEPQALEGELNRFDPHLVICSPPIPTNLFSDRLAWIELSPHPEKPSKIRVED